MGFADIDYCDVGAARADLGVSDTDADQVVDRGQLIACVFNWQSGQQEDK